MKRCNYSLPSQLRKDYHILFIRKKHDIFLEREGYFMKKNMYSVLLHFFLFVCLVIPFAYNRKCGKHHRRLSSDSHF